MTTYNEELLRIEKQRMMDDQIAIFNRSCNYEKAIARLKCNLEEVKAQRDKAEDRCDLLIEELAEVKTRGEMLRASLNEALKRIEELQAPATPGRPQPVFEAGQRWIDQIGWVHIIMAIKGNTIEYDLRDSVDDKDECITQDQLEYFLGMYNQGNLTLLPPEQPEPTLQVGQVWKTNGGFLRTITQITEDKVHYDFRDRETDPRPFYTSMLLRSFLQMIKDGMQLINTNPQN